MRARLHAATILVVATTAATLGTAVLTAASATPDHAAAAIEATTITNIAYAPAQPRGSLGHLLDLYLPAGTTPRPLLIWSSGSAWTSDNGKSGASSLAAALNAAGYAVAGVSVRLDHDSGCQSTTATGSPNPTWDTVIGFLNAALGTGPVSPSPSRSASPTPGVSLSPSPSRSAPPSPSASAGSPRGCSAVATVQTQWGNGYVIQPLTITNTGQSAITRWTVTFTLPAGHTVTRSWNTSLTSSGQTITLNNVGFNGTIAPAGSITSVGYTCTAS